MVGSQPIAKFQVLRLAIDAIDKYIFVPLRPVHPPGTARPFAINYLRQQLSEVDRKAILDQVARQGIEEWAGVYHMSFGMAVRNKLREADYDERALGVDSLDEVWAHLILEAARSGAAPIP